MRTTPRSRVRCLRPSCAFPGLWRPSDGAHAVPSESSSLSLWWRSYEGGAGGAKSNAAGCVRGRALRQPRRGSCAPAYACAMLCNAWVDLRADPQLRCCGRGFKNAETTPQQVLQPAPQKHLLVRLQTCLHHARGVSRAKRTAATVASAGHRLIDAGAERPWQTERSGHDELQSTRLLARLGCCQSNRSALRRVRLRFHMPRLRACAATPCKARTVTAASVSSMQWKAACAPLRRGVSMGDLAPSHRTGRDRDRSRAFAAGDEAKGHSSAQRARPLAIDRLTISETELCVQRTSLDACALRDGDASTLIQSRPHEYWACKPCPQGTTTTIYAC